jgi:hypothetical protein
VVELQVLKILQEAEVRVDIYLDLFWCLLEITLSLSEKVG